MGRPSIHLITGRVEEDLEVGNGREFLAIVFLVWIDKVLNLCHFKLSHSQQARARGDLITKCFADLSAGEWKTTGIEFQETLEVNKNTLSCLWPEKTIKM